MPTDLSSPMATGYILHVVCIQDLAWKPKGLHFSKPSLYVTVKLGATDLRTSTIKRNSAPTWNEFLEFSSPEASSIFHIELVHQSSIRQDRCIGWIDIEFSSLLKKCPNGQVTGLLLTASSGVASTTYVCALQVRLMTADATTSTQVQITAASTTLQQSGITGSAEASDSTAVAIVDASSNLVSSDGDLYRTIGSLLAKLDVFVGVVDALSEAHPYLKLAWAVTSAIYKVVSSQFKCDKKIIDLVQCMEDAFGFVAEIKSLPYELPSFQKVIVRLLQQTTECCLFVQQYARRPFSERLLDISSKMKIDDFEQSFIALKQSLDSGVGRSTAFISSRISSKVDNLILSDRLQPDKMNAFDRPQCLLGTRVELLAQVQNFLVSDADQNILWLNGVAGSGKSTVSSTVAQYFRTISRLGAFLFFERGKSQPSSVIRTIAYKLTSFDTNIAKHVVAAIEQGNDIAEASAATQFEKLLLEPLTAAADDMHGPVVNILDALDECGDALSRRTLTQLIRRELPKLPKCFRFLITSRKENDIENALSSRPDYVREMQLDSESQSSQSDVLSFISKKMHEVVRERVPVPPTWPWETNMALLGKAAGGLFIWASTAVKVVGDSDDPLRKLNELVTCARLPSGYDLSGLYSNVLHNSGISWSDRTSTARFQLVLSLILYSKVPLTIAEIDDILGFGPDSSSLLVLSRLQSVLVYSADSSVRLLHASFSDYLLTPERSGDPWFIDISLQNALLAVHCFIIMKSLLRFNICGIESSYLPNDHIVELPDRIRERIPSHLTYACLYWSHHLREALFLSALQRLLLDFLYTRLLYWLEVLSFLRKVNRAYTILADAAEWTGSRDDDFPSLLKDASTSITRFAECITHSASHTYVSMLPFLSGQSPIFAHYLQRAASLVQLDSKGNQRRSLLLKEIRGSVDAIMSVAFSPDGTRVASGSGDQPVCIWDTQTGELVSGPFKGHTDYVMSIAFSPDGARIASGSYDKTVRIWDSHTGELVVGPLEGHTDHVNSVVFSPDGTRVSSGSSDKTVRIWDSHTGELVVGPLEGHTDHVNSVVFSLDGTRVSSGSSDKTVRIWDAQTGELVSGPFKGHTDYVMSIAFSPDGARIASGSYDNTVRIWDAQIGELVSGPFKGHTNGVNSVSFSPDGARVASGSEDMIIRIWDAQTGQLVCSPFDGHTDWVWSVSFSPDGTRVASGSEDMTVCIWDAQSGELLSEPFKGHLAWINSVAFSPDGTRVASGSGDRTVHIWDVQTGQLVAGPFKGHADKVSSVAFSPDGVRIASGSGDKTICIWDVQTGELVSQPFEGHASGVNSVAFSPDGTRVASGSYDMTIRIWDAQTGQLACSPFDGHTDWVWSVSFSPDGTRVASGSSDKTIRIWDVQTGQLVSEPFEGHDSGVRTVAFSPDGARVVSGSFDKTVRIWNAQTGELVSGPFEAHTAWITSVAFSPDGARVASGSVDKTIRITDTRRDSSDACDGSMHRSSSSDNEGDLLNWKLTADGWVVTRQNELLLWVPPDVRPTLWHPETVALFSCEFSTKLDFAHAALGERWQECYNAD